MTDRNQILRFYKYHGTGNDFILVDNRVPSFIDPDPATVAWLCHRRFGIGADGLILLEASSSADFSMRYYNSNGFESSMCGNGGRCIAAFASKLGIAGAGMRFDAVDGVHESRILSQQGPLTRVALKMGNVDAVSKERGGYIMNTGSPHLVVIRPDIAQTDVSEEGKAIRNSEPFRKEGINVNFVQPGPGNPRMRTYERGVEAETWSCGTGTVAAAIALDLESSSTGPCHFLLETPGGSLEVRFVRNNGIYTDIWLTGPAVYVFEGSVKIPDTL